MFMSGGNYAGKLRYKELYVKLVAATLRCTDLKFLATYIDYEVQDDYDDNPIAYWYEFGPYPLWGTELIQMMIWKYQTLRFLILIL